MQLSAALAENAALKATIATLSANLEAVQFQLAQLRRMIFGHKAERLDIDAHSGLLFEVAPPPAPEPRAAKSSSRRAANRCARRCPPTCRARSRSSTCPRKTSPAPAAAARAT